MVRRKLNKIKYKMNSNLFLMLEFLKIMMEIPLSEVLVPSLLALSNPKIQQT